MNVGTEGGRFTRTPEEDGSKTKKLEIKMGTKRNKSMITCPTEPMVKNLQ